MSIQKLVALKRDFSWHPHSYAKTGICCFADAKHEDAILMLPPRASRLRTFALSDGPQS
jgi:hypothetical protein